MARCRNDHELTPDNTRTRTRQRATGTSTSIVCLDCQKEAQERYRASGALAARARERRKLVGKDGPQPSCKCGGGKPVLPSTRSGPGAGGRCSDCHLRVVNKWRQNNPDQHRASVARRRRALIDGFIDAYGGACTCCGETTKAFLTLDHVNNDGGGRNRHQEGKGTSTILRQLRRAGRPIDPAYTVACFNCNTGRHINGGTCPHEDTRKDPTP